MFLFNLSSCIAAFLKQSSFLDSEILVYIYQSVKLQLVSNN